MSPSRPVACLIDLSGTLHVGSKATPNAAQALKRLRESGLPLRFLSNTTKQSRASLLRTLHELDLDVREHELRTSLSAAHDLVKSRKLRPLLLLSESALEDFSDVESTAPYDAVVVGLAPDRFDYKTLNEAFQILNNRSLKPRAPLIVTHRALYYKSDDDKLSLGPGGFISALEQAAEVQAEVVGKPERAYFVACLRSLEKDGIDESKWQQVAMIGDDWRNDLGGGAEELGLRRKYQEGDEKRAKGLAGTEADFASLVDRLLN